MKADIEVYDGGKGIIKIEDDAGNIVARYEVESVRLEMPTAHVAAKAEDFRKVKTYRIETFRN